MALELPFEVFVCPLCGLQRNVNRWNPDSLPDKIIIREKAGGGYARGFTTISETTADYDAGGLDVEALRTKPRRARNLIGADAVGSADDVGEGPASNDDTGAVDLHPDTAGTEQLHGERRASSDGGDFKSRSGGSLGVQSGAEDRDKSQARPNH